ncbi:beta-galactosidase family protein [Nocardioides sp. NPDC101246]|uniref:glycoside hydrolase family 35 protein n=1 Tax=Nocardioides sp. NPDC101246 TaxID=3364336 RepID=UPI003829BB58
MTAAKTPAQNPALTWHDGRFLKHGVPHRILSGSIHYFRVHPDLWEDRLRRVAATGFNTVDTYVAWNFHEPDEGSPDFTGPRDLARFVTVAGDLGLDVIVRPGPYICAEWTNGALPSWLTARTRAPRSSDPVYQDAVSRWFDVLLPQLVPLQAAHGGPVVAVQVENEYGSYGDDAAHLAWIRQALLDRGVTELLYTADGPTEVMLDAGMLEGTLAAATFGSRATEAHAMLRSRRAGEPFLCAELWNGWFDHWGENHHVRSPASAAATLREIVDLGGSVSVYMAHGGTNFELWAGANHDGRRIQPTVTSYDSDAPVGEDGRVSEKFGLYREILAPATGRTVDALPALPPTPARLGFSSAPISSGTDLLSLMTRGAATRAARPLSFEELGIEAGLVTYRSSVTLPGHDVHLTVRGLHDVAYVFLDGDALGMLERDDAEASVLTLPGLGRAAELTLVVEALGRINYGPLLGDHKGILGGVQVDRRLVHGWDHHPAPLDRWDALDGLPRAVIDIDTPADGWLAVPGDGDRFIWLNGTLLGRLWARGPQRRLYAPAPLWHPGANQVAVLDLTAPAAYVEVHPDPDFGPTEEYVETLPTGT